MKTAVSIPDPLFERIESTRKALGMSRSELFARAAEQWLESRDSATLTARINQVCADVETDLDEHWAQAQVDAIGEEPW